MNKDSSAALTNRASFMHWTHVPIRFSDQDSLGHVNNVAFKRQERPSHWA